MRFLVDRCAGRILADWFRALEHDVVETREIGADPGDTAILEWAQRENRVLITTDKDFGKLMYVDFLPHCGVVRLPQVPHEHRISLMEAILSNYADDLQNGAVVTAKGSRIRVSWPPMKP